MTTAIAPVTVTQRNAAAYWRGFYAYMDGKPEPTDPHERRGWWAALDTEARAEQAHEEWLDQEWIRRGNP